MTVQVTDHARKRILERLRCRPDKVQKVAEKMWASTDPLPARKRQKARGQRPSRQVRFFMGLFCVFAVNRRTDVAVLLTVMTSQRDPDWYTERALRMDKKKTPR